LFVTVIPTLERFPEIGRDLLTRPLRSVQAQLRAEALRTRIKAGSIREYIHRDWLILYSVAPDAVHRLAVKHHRQLSYDICHHWG
jgi:hypothetical protein